MTEEKNVLGTELAPCSTDPMTGYRRDGCCRHIENDHGRHEICAVMTQEFLEYSKRKGNDLLTPRPEFEFPGLEPGDRWCVCLPRWLEALDEEVAPPVILEATNESVLEAVYFSTLNEHEYEGTHPREFETRTEQSLESVSSDESDSGATDESDSLSTE